MSFSSIISDFCPFSLSDLDFLLIFSIFGEFFFKYYCIFGAYLLQYVRKTRYAGTHGFFANRQGSKSDP